jgi:hypothetical protein
MKYKDPLKQIMAKTRWYWDHDGVPMHVRTDCLPHLKIPSLPELRVLGHEKVDTREDHSSTTGALKTDPLV